MKKKIIIRGIVIAILAIVVAVVFFINSHEGHKIEGYGYGYKLPDDYRFVIIANDMSAVDGPSIAYYIYEDKIIYKKYSYGPNFSSMEVIVYEEVDTSDIENVKPEEINVIRTTDTTKIQETLERRKGKKVCDYTSLF